jgi:hypothetical protein
VLASISLKYWFGVLYIILLGEVTFLPVALKKITLTAAAHPTLPPFVCSPNAIFVLKPRLFLAASTSALGPEDKRFPNGGFNL